MTGYRIAPLIGLTLIFAAGCVDSAQTETAQAAEVLRESAAELQDDVRSGLDEFGEQMERLDERYSSATEDMAASWADTRSEIWEYREGLKTDLARLEGASADEARRVKREMAEDIERLTERLVSAELESVEDDRDFLSASRDRMPGLKEEIRDLGDKAASLTAEAREEASEAVVELRDRASELEIRLDALTDATAEEIASQRTDIAQAIGALTASVRREMFELRHDVTG